MSYCASDQCMRVCWQLPESQACLKGIMERMRQTQEILDRSRDSAAPTTLSSNPDRQDS